MKKFLVLFVCLLFVPVIVSGQMVMYNFDTIPDTTLLVIDGGEEPGQYLNVSIETTNVQEGAGALRVDWQNRCVTEWGGWIGLNFTHPDSLGVWDFSPYEEFSLWYYVEEKSSVADTKPNEVVFRVIFNDAGPGASVADGDQEIWMSFHNIVDLEPGWNQIVCKLEDFGEDAAHWNPEAGKGFWNPGWGQTATGDDIFDLDKIREIRFEFSQENGLWQQEADSVSGVLLLDEFKFQGVKPVNVVFFNGKSTPSDVNMFVGWSGSAEITDKDAYTPGTNSVKWNGGAGWDGLNFGLTAPKNLMFNWPTDSVQFKIKAPAGLGDLNLVFHDVDDDGATKVDYAFQATYALTEADNNWDGNWKEIKIALKDFNRFAGIWDNDLGQSVAGEFDSSKVAQFTIGNMGQDTQGKVVYFDDIWTGNPEFDWIPPEVVTGVSGVPSDQYNLVIWEDVPDEAGEVYNVYASPEPITDVNAVGVEVVATGVLENTQTTVHWIYYPLVSADVVYYYAVVCVDASGNVGPAGLSGATTNAAKPVPTISLNPPADFIADGDLSEWDASGIMPWVLTPENYTVSAGTVTDAADLTATVYLAMDDEYFYVAFDVIDDVYSFNTEGNWYQWDAFEMYIGLYDQRGDAHSSSPWDNRGAEPDYKLVFQQDRFFNEFRTGGMENDIIYTSDDENYYFEEFGGADYAGEAKIPLDSIVIGDDVRFHPVNGMKLPFELVFHDNDGDGTSTDGWEGNLVLSPKDDDNSWQYVWQWTHVWIGDTTDMVTSIDSGNEVNVAKTYSLSQNYPNPFNPTTTINYSIATSGKVKIAIYNMLGQKVKTLVNANKIAGNYTININADNLTSGVYFYRIETQGFAQTRKMVLMK